MQPVRTSGGRLLPAVMLLLCHLFVRAQWSPDPSINTPVAVVPFDQVDVRITEDGRGGAIMVWEDGRDGSGFSSIFAQRLDASGYAMWSANGVVVVSIAGSSQSFTGIESDGAGGAIVVWQDGRSGDRDIYVQRVDSSGNLLWAASGVAVAVKAGQQQNPKTTPDGSGGVFIVWQDSTPTGWDVYAQRVDKSGNVLWQAGGIAVCAAAGEQINPRIDTDSAYSGAVIVWQDKRNGIDYDIYVQKISNTGLPQWTAGGMAVAALAGTQNNPKIESDFQGGAVIAWQDLRNGLNYDIYAQRVGSAGTALWAANGIAVCAAAGNQSAIDFTTYGTNGAVIAWKDARSGTTSDVYAQRVDMNGNVLWTANGVPVSIAVFDQLNPNTIGDGAGNAIIAWQDASGNGFDVFAQKLSPSGAALWTAGGVPVGTAASMQAAPKHVSDGSGGAIFAWEDARKGVEFDVYAHHLLADGTTALQRPTADYSTVRIYPNPVRSLLHVTLPEGPREADFIISLLDATGREVMRIHSGGVSSNIIADLSALPAGLYLLRINGHTAGRVQKVY